MNNKILSLYAVRNQEGKYFKNIGYGGIGKNWVDSLDKARIYTKIGQARSRITYFAENHPSYGRPELIELVVEKVVVVDDSETVAKNKKKKLQSAIRNANHTLDYYEKQDYGDIKKIKTELEYLKKELEKLK